LYQAPKELGKIPKTLFLLRFIDEPLFRQAIEKQLNTIESAQKFSRSVSFGHDQEILQADKVEQDLAEGCRRLIKDAIMCWNYLFLTQRLQDTQTDEQREALRTAVQHGSVVSW
jgi:TnpA family transposase